MTYSPEKNRLRSLERTLRLRDQLMGALRAFFSERDFIEIDTPVRIAAPAPEVHIEAVASEDALLRTSPELHMKRLLAAGYERIYQLGPCFRAGEEGRHHRSEFTMLEWYRANATYSDILADTKSLVIHLAESVLGTTNLDYQGQSISLSPRWERITVSQAFLAHAGWDPCAGYDADRFDIDLVERVEPALPKDIPVILTDYPAEAAALARCKHDQRNIAERWELYIGGLELANAYSELTDAAEQRLRFHQWTEQRRKDGKKPYPQDEAFLNALEEGFPEAGGIAMGVDRLVMLLADAPSLDEVLPFRE